MESVENVVVLVRLCGTVFAVERQGDTLRIVEVGRYVTAPPDQRPALELLRKD